MSFVSKIANLAVTNAKTSEKVSCDLLWKDSDAVIYFMRRFGCPVCRWICHEISKLEPQLTENNVKLIGVAPEKFGLEDFVAGKFFSGDLYLDEEKNAYTTLNFGRFSMLGALGAAVDADTRKINSEAKKVGITGNIKGDIKQLGGLLIVRKGGEELFYFKQEKASDYVKNSEILEKLGINGKSADDSIRPDMTCPLSSPS